MSKLIVSYQMGKVASSTITKSIPGCVQFHSWSGEEPIMFFSSRYTGSMIGRIKQHYTWKVRFLSLKWKYLKAIKNNTKPLLIIGVRDPVSRAISGYFQSLTEREKGLATEEHIDRFFSHCPHMLALKWFDIELKLKLGIDVYKHPFDLARGSTRFETNEFNIYIYQMEKLRSLESEIAEIIEDPEFKLLNSNENKDKWSNTLYNNFISKLELPSAYIDLMYNNQYFEHFYGHDAKEDHQRKWKNKTL